jgi:hypothetical protein
VIDILSLVRTLPSTDKELPSFVTDRALKTLPRLHAPFAVTELPKLLLDPTDREAEKVAGPCADTENPNIEQSATEISEADIVESETETPKPIKKASPTLIASAAIAISLIDKGPLTMAEFSIAKLRTDIVDPRIRLSKIDAAEPNSVNSTTERVSRITKPPAIEEEAIIPNLFRPVTDKFDPSLIGPDADKDEPMTTPLIIEGPDIQSVRRIPKIDKPEPHVADDFMEQDDARTPEPLTEIDERMFRRKLLSTERTPEGET